MKTYKDIKFTDERSLMGEHGIEVSDCIFEKGESPLKECRDINMTDSLLKWKYPLWYCENAKLTNCTLYEGARAGIWYTKNVDIRDSVIQAPKTFRRSSGIFLENVMISRADETLWSCKGVRMKNVGAKGDYFAMNSCDMEIDGLTLDGNYSFDGASNVVIRNSKLLTKDAFWNSSNMTVYDSFISGEYLGWNSKDLTLIGCTIESLQGMCYIENLKMINCKLLDTSLAFEYSTVDAQIASGIDSVFNPTGGVIKAERIGELIIEKDKVDKNRTVIICDDIEKHSDKIDWERF